MAISSVSSNFVTALFSTSGTKASTALSLTVTTAGTGTMMAEKSQLETSRKAVVAAIATVGEIVRLTGEARDSYSTDAEAQPSVTTLLDAVDAVAAAGTDTDDQDDAISTYNSLRRDLVAAIGDLNSLAKSVSVTDRTTLNKMIASVQSYINSSDANYIETADSDIGYDLTSAGNAAANDGGRSQARRNISDLATEAQDLLDRLVFEAQRIDMKSAAAASGLATAGVITADTNLQSALKSTESDLITQQRRLSTISRLIGSVEANLDDPVPSSATSAETLQDLLGMAELTTYRSDAVAAFNELQETVADAIGYVSTVSSSYLIDQDSLNASLESVLQFINEDDPEYLKQASETASSDGSTFDFSDYGNATGTDNMRSEARRILNAMRQAVDKAIGNISTELTSLSTRIAGISAARYAGGYGPTMSSAISQASQFDAARRQLETGIATLNQLESLVGATADDVGATLALSASGESLQDYINMAADSDQLDNAVSGFNRLRETVLDKLTSLPSISGSILNDPDAATAVGDALIPYLEDQDALLFEAASTGTEGSWDLSATGNDYGTGDGRSAARRVLNKLQSAIQEAKLTYSRELIQITAQSEAAQVGKTAAISSLASSSTPSILSLMSSSSSDSSKLLAESVRKGLESNYSAVSSIIQSVGLINGDISIDRATDDDDATSLANLLNKAADTDKASAAASGYNSLVSDLQRLVTKMKSSNGSTLIDKTMVNSAVDRLSNYFDSPASYYGETTRADEVRAAAVSDGSDVVNVTEAGNSAGTDGGRTEARRTLANLRDQAASERSQLQLELLNQDARLIGLNAQSALQAKQYQKNLQALLSQDTTSSSGASYGSLSVSGSLSRMKSFLSS